MKQIQDYINRTDYKTQFEIIKANSALSYGGLRLFNGRRDYMMQSPAEFAATLIFLQDYFGTSSINFLEIGTASNLTNTMIWNNLNIQENVIIDNLECPGIAESLVGNLTFKPNTTLFIGSSLDNRIQAKVAQLGIKFDLMLIDGNHDFEFVTADFENYSKYLNNDGLLIFHDIDNDKVPGVRQFIQTNMLLNNNFVQCASFIESLRSFNKNTYGSKCGIGIYKKK